MRVSEQSLGRLLQRRVVRDCIEAQFAHEPGHIFQQRDDAAIVLPLMRLEHEQREQLRLGELLRAESVRVFRQRSLANRQRLQRHRPRRL